MWNKYLAILQTDQQMSWNMMPTKTLTYNFIYGVDTWHLKLNDETYH